MCHVLLLGWYHLHILCHLRVGFVVVSCVLCFVGDLLCFVGVACARCLSNMVGYVLDMHL